MVRPVVYSPTKPYKISDAAKAKYMEIAEAVKGSKAIDAKAAAAKVENALAVATQEDAWTPETDKISDKDAEYGGIVLQGMGGSGAVSGGELDVDLNDVYIEEPRIVVEEEDDEKDDERSLWGDGVPEPGQSE